MITPHLPAVFNSLAPLISQYGYGAVGGLLLLESFGLPLPGELTLIAASVYAGFGRLNIIVVIAVALIAAIVGDNIGYLIGRRGGRPLIERFGRYVWLTPKRLDQAEQFLDRRGSWVIMLARFVDGFRQLNGLIAGSTKMHWARFLTFNIIGAALWVGFWSLAGYYGGSRITAWLKYEEYFTIGVVILVLGAIALHVFRRRNNHPKVS